MGFLLGSSYPSLFLFNLVQDLCLVFSSFLLDVFNLARFVFVTCAFLCVYVCIYAPNKGWILYGRVLRRESDPYCLGRLGSSYHLSVGL